MEKSADNRNRKALIAMSGGVDSSVAAFLMKEKGFDVSGVTLKMFGNDLIGVSGESSCCSLSDVEDAESVCRRLGIPFYVFNFTEKFEKEVVQRFVKAYEEGRTPNPCVDCNRYMKFGRLFDMAEEQGCEKVVTGHYANVEYDEKKGLYKLRRAKDVTKDQTYVLYFLSQQQLARLYFPLGRYEKSVARDIAEEAGIIVARKHDSQDICFVPDGDYAGFIEREASAKVRDALEAVSSRLEDIEKERYGKFVDTDGNILGTHKGYYHYTIGQRRGLGIPAADRLYVVDIIPEKNQVILGANEDLFTREVNAVDFNLISYPEADKFVKDSDEKQMRVTAKVRYRAKDTSGVLTLRSDGTATMLFDEPVRAVTPGQSLVVYDGDYCLGGGTITS